MNELLKGQRVYWADPEDELSSGFGTITTVKCSPNEPITHDTIILVTLDSGSEVEAYALELQLVFDLVKTVKRRPQMTDINQRAQEWLQQGDNDCHYSKANCSNTAAIITSLLEEVSRLTVDLNIAKHTLGEYHIEASKELCMNSAVMALKEQNERLQSQLSRYEGAVEVEGVVNYDSHWGNWYLCDVDYLPKDTFTDGQRVKVWVKGES